MLFGLIPHVHIRLSDMTNGSGICLLFSSALMECEYWITANPDTNVAIQSSESRLAGYYSSAGTDFVWWD